MVRRHILHIDASHETFGFIQSVDEIGVEVSGMVERHAALCLYKRLMEPKFPGQRTSVLQRMQ